MPDQVHDVPYDLQTIFEALHTARSLADTLQAASDGIVSSLGFGRASVNLVRPDGDLVVASFSGDEETEGTILGRVGSRASWERRLSMGEAWGTLRFIPHTESPSFGDDGLPDWYTDGPVPVSDHEWHPADRLLAPIYMPGTHEQVFVGVIAVGEPHTGRHPGPAQRDALQAYALQAAIAISHSRLRSNMQRALIRLEREQQALRASEESFRQAFEYAPSGLAIAELGGAQHGRILRSNDALCRLLSRPASVLRRYSFADLVHPEDIGTLLRTSAEGGHAELRLGRRDGTYVWVSMRNSVVADTADGPRFLLTHIEDIEERKRRESDLVHRASHDALTGLPNAAELRSRLSAHLCSDPDYHTAAASPGLKSHTAAVPHVHVVAPRRDDGATGIAVLFCDLIGFAVINETLGYEAGDAVLIEVARRLSATVQERDTVARFGSDEFVILAQGLGAVEAHAYAVRLCDAIGMPIDAKGHRLSVSATIGVGWAQCGMVIEEILTSAARGGTRHQTTALEES
ncbi:diguanylate cyclase domain-containing protein [Streptomyces sp. NPDC057249]|uniref:diguanylate cyclase domain-containing protein n=1 Tax=Streptomyces sp. NPDC057249 TaxID=3346067 RepID=UPI003625FFFE